MSRVAAGVREVDRQAVFAALAAGAHPSAAIVLALPEQVEAGERDRMAEHLRRLAMAAPRGVLAGRVGLTSYVVLCDEPPEALVVWALHAARSEPPDSPVHIGIGALGGDAMAAFETLEVGAHEAARAAPDRRVLVLDVASSRVVPADEP